MNFKKIADTSFKCPNKLIFKVLFGSRVMAMAAVHGTLDL